jgi:AraC family transcriptional regulator
VTKNHGGRLPSLATAGDGCPGHVASGPGEPLAHAGSDWRALPIALWPIVARGEMAHHHRDTAVLLVARSGSGRRWYRSGLVRRELHTAPRMIELYGSGFTLDWARWEGTAGDCVGVELPGETVARLLHDDARRFNPPTRHEVFDDEVADLVLMLWGEASRGAPNGALYADGLSLALLALLVSRYLAPHDPVPGARRLSGEQRRRVRDLIESSLGDNVSLERLAAAAELSPFHFARSFKATFGATPHRFMLERRIHAAAAALRADPDRPIVDIAFAFAFASQAHFTYTFRRLLGTTPARWRHPERPALGRREAP